MHRVPLLFACLLALPSSAFATWSILAVDKVTGRVVMAAASCVNTTDEAMKTAIAVVVPGKGVAACQAAADNTHENLNPVKALRIRYNAWRQNQPAAFR